MDTLYSMVVASVLGAFVIIIGTLRMPAGELRWLSSTLTVALLLRLFTAATFATFHELRIFHEDADGYEEFGMLMSLGWKHLAPPFMPIGDQNYGYVYVAAAIYYVFGQFRPLVSCVNAVVGVATILVIYRLARSFFHPLVARRVALMSSLMPSMILWSSVAMKDALMTLLIVIALYCCVAIKRRFSIMAMIGLAVSLLAMQPLRFYMVYFVGFAVLVSLFMERSVRLVSGVYKQVLIGAVFIALLLLVGLAGRAEQGVDYLTFDRLSRFRHAMATTANSGFEADADISTPLRALLFLPIGMAELLLGPFPWQFGSLRATFAAPETVYWWFMFPAMLRGMWWMFRKRFTTTSPLIIFSVTLTCAYSLVHGNIGSGFRQRAQIFVVLFLFAALGRFRSRCKKAGLDPDLLLTPDHASPTASAPSVGKAA